MTTEDRAGKMPNHLPQAAAVNWASDRGIIRMSEKPRVVLLNGTCLDVVEEQRKWLSEIEIDLIAKQSFRSFTAEQIETLLADADGIIVPASVPITTSRMGAAPRLRVISFAASGYDSLDVAAATRANIVVTNSPVKEGAEVVADMAWGLLLAVGRQIPQHDRQVRAGNLERGMGFTPWRKKLGIVGLGNIGRAVARRAAGFEMQVLASEPSPDMDFVKQYDIRLVELEELLTESDFVSLHVRLDAETRGMIGESQLSTMKRTAFLVNTARRELVDEEALERALAENRLAGAGLDDPPADPNSPLLQRESLVFTTHLGNRARVGVDAVFRQAVRNAADVLVGRPCQHVVNPEVLKQQQTSVLTT